MILGHLGIEYSLVLLLDLTDLLLDFIDKFIHVVDFALDRVVCFDIRVDLLGICPQTVGQALDFDGSSDAVHDGLYIFFAVFELFHLDHHILDFSIGFFDGAGDIAMIIHQLVNNI